MRNSICVGLFVAAAGTLTALLFAWLHRLPFAVLLEMALLIVFCVAVAARAARKEESDKEQEGDKQ